MSEKTLKTFTMDGAPVPFKDGQTVLDAALAAGVFIPHLCHNPEFDPHSSCRLCTVSVNGRHFSSCTYPASEGLMVLNDTAELNEMRLALTQMMFVEGNHFCPACEKSGGCKLQATGYDLGLQDNHYPQFYKRKESDASHPEIFLDRDRCILCELCVRASRDMDGKNVFGIAGRGFDSRLVVNAASGRLADTNIAITDRAVDVCPVGAITIKRKGYVRPIGKRIYDRAPISVVGLGHVPPAKTEETVHGK